MKHDETSAGYPKFGAKQPNTKCRTVSCQQKACVCPVTLWRNKGPQGLNPPQFSVERGSPQQLCIQIKQCLRHTAFLLGPPKNKTGRSQFTYKRKPILVGIKLHSSLRNHLGATQPFIFIVSSLFLPKIHEILLPDSDSPLSSIKPSLGPKKRSSMALQQKELSRVNSQEQWKLWHPFYFRGWRVNVVHCGTHGPIKWFASERIFFWILRKLPLDCMYH